MKGFARFKKEILRHFPVPGFVVPHSVGIDISDKSIKFVSFKETKDGIYIESCGSEKLPSGVVVEGAIQDPKKLSAILRGMKEEHGFQYVHASLPEEQAFLFTVPLPEAIDEDEIRDLISFKLEEYVPIASVDAIFDYQHVYTEDTKDVRKETNKNIVVSVFPHTLGDSYTAIFLDAGLTPISFEIEAQAIARSVIPDGTRASTMIVDFGRTRSGLSVAIGDSVVFTTTVDIGGDILTETVQKMYPDADNAKVDQIKREQGCFATDDNKELCTTLIPTVSALRDEINRHLIYWQTHEKKEDQPKVKKIILCGGNSNLGGLVGYLERGLRIPVEHADVWVNTALLKNGRIPNLSKYESLGYAPAIGLALHHMHV
jgi:type IV pilus assembly protein PilM